MLHSRTARWSVSTAVLCVALLVAAWFLLITPRRAEAGTLADERTSSEQQNAMLEIRIAQLKAEFAQLPATQAVLAAIREQIPAEADMPALVRDMHAMAGATGLTLESIAPGEAIELGSGGGSGGRAATGTGTTSGSASGLIGIPVTIVIRGDYFQEVAFLQQVQTQLKRSVLITGLELGPAQEAGAEGQIEISVTGQVFVMPQDDTASTSGTGTSSTGTSSTGTSSTGTQATSGATS